MIVVPPLPPYMAGDGPPHQCHLDSVASYLQNKLPPSKLPPRTSYLHHATSKQGKLPLISTLCYTL